MSKNAKKKRQKDPPLEKQLEEAIANHAAEYKQWYHYRKYGGQDPSWPDGCNMHLIRNHIIYYKRQMKELCGQIGCELPECYAEALPPEVDRDYNLKLTDLNKGHLIKFYENVSRKSYSSAKNCRVILLTALRYAVGKKLIPENPAEGIYVPKSENDKKKEKQKQYRTINIDSQSTLTVEQLKLLIEKAKATKIYMYILFAGLMGLRKSEILGLKYSDIDFTRQTLYVQRQLGKDLSKPQDELPKKTLTKQEVSLKTRSSKRVLDIPDIVFNAILEQRKIYEKNRRRRPGQFQDDGYICCSSYGRPQSNSYCYKGYKKLLSDNGLPNIRFHDLRHTYATILSNEEIDVKAISNSLGHSKTIITVDVYTETKRMIVDASEQTQELAYEIFPLSYLKDQQTGEIKRTRFLKEIYYFPEALADEIMGGILKNGMSNT